MLLYCDHCATKHGYDVDVDKKINGECELCHRRIGPMNIMSDEDVEVLIGPETTEIVEVGGFGIRQIPGFVPGTKIRDIEPTLPYKTFMKKIVLFIDINRVVLSNYRTGKKIEIKF